MKRTKVPVAFYGLKTILLCENNFHTIKTYMQYLSVVIICSLSEIDRLQIKVTEK